MKPAVGIIGFRGMVGSVLVDRMLQEGDFELIEPLFFSTSQSGAKAPSIGRDVAPVGDAASVDSLKKLDMLVSCQGGDYTKEMLPALRKAGFKGLWIDAASTLRMEDDTVIVLDPLNKKQIDLALRAGVVNFAGGNCTVSLMLMAVHGLYEQNLVEWISTMTYQAASGAGAKNMRELCLQMRALGSAASPLLNDPASSALELDRVVSSSLRAADFPQSEFGAPLAASLIPWIDRAVDGGQTREEWKGHVESNKILGLTGASEVAVDGICVRVGAMRCHSQGLTLKLRRDVPLDVVEQTIREANEWVSVVPNDKASTLEKLSPAAVTGTLGIPVGRIKRLRMGPSFVGAFTVGDQLLWGAAEPLRRMVRIALEHR